MEDLLREDVQNLLRAIWNDPQSLDPARRRARATREVAATLGELARALEARFPSEAIARFLMRCVFTFFAEDGGLLPEGSFQGALDRWRKDHGLSRAEAVRRAVRVLLPPEVANVDQIESHPAVGSLTAREGGLAFARRLRRAWERG